MSTTSKPSLAQRLSSGLGMLALLALLGAIALNFQNLLWSELTWLGLFVLTTVIRMPFMRQTKDNDITVDQKTPQERFLLLFMFLSMGILPLVYLASKGGQWDLLAFANYSLPGWAPLLGLALILPYAVLFWRAHHDLGRNWSATLEMHDEHTLVTNGIYKYLRHPMYAAIWIAVIAQPLLLHNWLAGGLIVLAFLAMYILRIPKEEAMMIRQFGPDYEAYMARTGRVFPKLF